MDKKLIIELMTGIPTDQWEKNNELLRTLPDKNTDKSKGNKKT